MSRQPEVEPTKCRISANSGGLQLYLDLRQLWLHNEITDKGWLEPQ